MDIEVNLLRFKVRVLGVSVNKVFVNPMLTFSYESVNFHLFVFT